MTSRLAFEKRACCGAEDLELAKGLPSDSLSLLLRGALYAQNACRPTWDFAIELGQLRAAGLNDCDLRWLACKGYIEHGVENARRTGVARGFDNLSDLRFTRRSSFALTPRGLVLAKSLLDDAMALRAELAGPCAAVSRRRTRRVASVPNWDRQRRELRLGRIVVKQYRVPAENQELILAAFEEEAWPARIDDPLPFAPRSIPNAACIRPFNVSIAIERPKCCNSTATAAAMACAGKSCRRPTRLRAIKPTSAPSGPIATTLSPVCVHVACTLRVDRSPRPR